jgi:hypothetical protein
MFIFSAMHDFINKYWMFDRDNVIDNKMLSPLYTNNILDLLNICSICGTICMCINNMSWCHMGNKIPPESVIAHDVAIFLW